MPPHSGPSSPASADRRDVLAAALGWLGVATLGAPAPADDEPEPLLDIHVHLFGVGDAGTGCRMQKAITDGWQFKGLAWALGLRKRAKTLDEGYEHALLEHVKKSELGKAAILGQDAAYDHKGKADWSRTSFFVPNDYVFTVVARHAETMIPCPSINPDRGDALDELNRCHAKGARLFKIHPPTQGVDVAHRKHEKFFRRCKDLGMVVLVHTGHEHSAPVIDKDLANPKRLERALDQGCTMVACHAGTGWATDTPDQLPEFLNLLKRYKNLWGDTSVLGTPGRVRDFGRLLKEPLARERLLHGSDFPFPVSASAFADRIGRTPAERIDKERSWLKRDLDLKEALGIGRASAKRGYELARGRTPK
jgi:predicted TIM-barrel fold metal-dependent hydrolase